MKEKPILMSGDMVRAVLDGRKTQTRRAVKLIPQDKRTILCSFSNEKGAIFNDGRGLSVSTFVPIRCPYGQPGDRLWVREAWMPYFRPSSMSSPSDGGILYRADKSRIKMDTRGRWEMSRVGKWRPSIHMPRWASRITLEITGVRVERVQDISDGDISEEGISPLPKELGYNKILSSRTNFRNKWDSLYDKRGYSWDDNPWVWVIEFRASKL